MNTFEFEITIQSKSGDYSWPIVLRCKPLHGLTTHSSGILQLSQDDFYKLTQEQENEKAYGIILGKALFRGNVRDTFVRALSKSSQDCPLRILLSIEAADNDQVRTLHWERLCAPIDNDDSWQLLARDQRVPFSRYIPSPIDRRFPPIGRRDLRALVLVASPANIGKFQLAPFDVETVVSRVKEALGQIHPDILANNVAGALGPPTLQELSKQLTNAKKPYTLLHFVCHGKLIDNGETVLYWAQADNQVLLVTGTELLDELSNIGGRRGLPHFAFLCTCESADPRAEGALGGLAQRLVRELGMPAVIAMTRKVSVETGLALGQNFYRRLRESGEVDTALQEATAGLSKRHDITVPALFSRLGGRPLFSDRLEDRELTDEEINDGIEKLRQLLQERAPNASVLKQRFETQVKTLKDTRGAELRTARQQRQQAIVELNNLCEQVIEISFDALAALDKEPPEYKAECPFPGLSSFAEKKYHKFFFGRDELIRDLQKEVAKDNFLAVIGTSGSGKSSVVLAGLIPKLKEEELSLQCADMTPGKEPLERLSKVSEQHSILVVDQFEEVFTLCEDKADRVEFIKKLLNFADRRKVVITMRADFLGECTFYPELRKRIETRQKLVGPMQPAELITAMKMQADKADLRFEAGLSDSIVNDVKKEAGAMPLLQYALQELWKRRHGPWLCHEEYQAIGRVEQAIAKTADDFYNSLPASEQEQVRNIFLRLTRMDANALQGKTGRDTRRRVELEDLVSAGSDLAVTKKLVQQLAGEKARLVVTSRNEATEKDEVEVAHEALISYWPKLQKWLDENRNDLLLRQDINDAAEKWQQHQEQLDKDSYLTHKGGRLEDAEKLLKQPKLVHLNPLEADYVKACVELRDRQIREEDKRKQRELEQERKARQAAQRATVITLIAAPLVTALFIAVGINWRARKIEEIRNFNESSKVLLASNKTFDALITSLQAGKKLKQLILPPSELQKQLRRTLQQTLIKDKGIKEFNRIEGHKDEIRSVTFSPDGKIIATASKNKTVQLWSMNGEKFKTLLHGGEVSKVLFSPNSQIIATISSDQNVTVWNTKGDKIKTFQHDGRPSSLVFSPDGQMIATVSGDRKAVIWRIDTEEPKILNYTQVMDVKFSPDGKKFIYSTLLGTKLSSIEGKEITSLFPYYIPSTQTCFSHDGKIIATGNFRDNTIKLWSSEGQLLKVLTGHKTVVSSINFSSNGNTFVSTDLNGVVKLWSAGGDKSTTLLHDAPVLLQTVKFSPDSQIIITADKNKIIKLWRWNGQLLKTLTGHQATINAVSFSPDGQTIATASNDNTVKLWSRDGKELKTLYHNYAVLDVSFKADGKTIVTIDKNQTVKFWNHHILNLKTLEGHKESVNLVTFSPDGKTIATASYDTTVKLWSRNGKEIKTLPGPSHWIYGISFSPDNQMIAFGCHLGILKLGNIRDNNLRTVGSDSDKRIDSVSFSPDGKMIATGESDGFVKLWNRDQGIRELKHTLVKHKDTVTSISFSPDGKTFATASDDRTARLWSINGEELKILSGHRDSVLSVIFSPDGKTITTLSKDGMLKLWSRDGKELETIQYGDVFESVSFSPDGKIIASANGDNTVKLWSRDGDLLETLFGHQDKVLSVSFSPDGKIIGTASDDKSAIIWNLALDKWTSLLNKELDELMVDGCNWVRDYLKNPSANLSESDRHLCHGIGAASNLHKANRDLAASS